MKNLLCLGLCAALLSGITACDDENTNDKQESNCTAICRNGRFVGKAEAETGVLSFKGIPYAKAPMGNLRWKAPVAPDDCDSVKTAYEFGKSSVQYEWFSEPIQTPVGEDCLTLNVWTSGLTSDKKPVMVFFHGGSYGWGGTSEQIYNGQYIVAAHPEVIVVTCNYRLGLLGFNNFDGIPGGEDYSESQNLGVLDLQLSLQWIKENIAAFGGDADNVTVFGESAGGGMICALLDTDCAGSLFQRAIIESGAANILMSKNTSVERRQWGIRALMQVTGCSTMQQLVALPEEEYIEAIGTECDEEGNTPSDFSNIPVCGSYPLHDDPYEALVSGNAKNVDIMIGTNLDELNYWINEMGDRLLVEMSEEERQESLAIFGDVYIAGNYNTMMSKLTEAEQANVAQYLARYAEMEDYLAKSRLLSDVFYRQPSIKMAETHSTAGVGRTYMYLFEKRNTDFDYLGAAHAMELPYVFLNTNEPESYGEVDMNLAACICEAWVNFARTGNPSTSTAAWPEYNEADRQTMVFGDDGSAKAVSDPYAAERELLLFTKNYDLKQSTGS